MSQTTTETEPTLGNEFRQIKPDGSETVGSETLVHPEQGETYVATTIRSETTVVFPFSSKAHKNREIRRRIKQMLSR